MTSLNRRRLLRLAGAGATTLALGGTLSGCMSGEGAGSGVANANSSDRIRVDYATYNPLSLIIRKKGWLEDVAEDLGQSVSWTKSAGSNKANQALIAAAIDVGSTAGSAALLARSNGAPIKVVDLYSQPEWSALVRTKDSPLRSVEDLKGKSVAVTKGTDPYFLLLQALQQAGMSSSDITVQNLQHADGRSALDSHRVDAWAGLDPIMATAENAGDVLFYRNISFNTYGFLNAREDFLKENPRGAQAVVNTYSYARTWALAHADEARRIFAEEASISSDVAAKVWERTHLDIDPVPGEAQKKVLRKIGPFLVESGDVSDSGSVSKALDSIVEQKYARAADPDAVAAVLTKSAKTSTGSPAAKETETR